MTILGSSETLWGEMYNIFRPLGSMIYVTLVALESFLSSLSKLLCFSKQATLLTKVASISLQNEERHIKVAYLGRFCFRSYGHESFLAHKFAKPQKSFVNILSCFQNSPSTFFLQTERQNLLAESSLLTDKK